MIRTNISITDKQHKFLRQEAYRRHVSIAQLVRELIDEAIEETEERSNDTI